MTIGTKHNLHVPLSEDLHTLLRDEAARTGIPATTLVREALAAWLKQRRRERLFAEIQAYAAAHAGTEADLDEGLEEAGLEILAEELWPDVESSA